MKEEALEEIKRANRSQKLHLMAYSVLNDGQADCYFEKDPFLHIFPTPEEEIIKEEPKTPEPEAHNVVREHALSPASSEENIVESLERIARQVGKTPDEVVSIWLGHLQRNSKKELFPDHTST